MSVLAAETYVCGPACIDVDMLDFFAFRIKDCHPPASKVNVAFVVDGHTVRSHRAEELFIRELAVFVYFIKQKLCNP